MTVQVWFGTKLFMQFTLHEDADYDTVKSLWEAKGYRVTC